MNNSIMVLHPYYYNGLWVFDDEATGLVREAFVAGIPEILEALLEEYKVENPKSGFNLLFSANPFPGYQAQGTWFKEEMEGNWYEATLPNGQVQHGWLCPALFQYFEKAPENLYIRVESKKQ